MPGKSRKSIQNHKIICAQCKLEIKEETEDNIACDKCEKVFHSQCSKLDKRQYAFLLENERDEYICHYCEEGDNGIIKEELLLIKTKLNKLDQLSHIQDSITFLSKQYDDILKGLGENNKKLNEVKKENCQLKEEIKQLKSSVKMLNDEKVNNDCIVIGIEQKENESAAESVVKFSRKNGVEISPGSIDDAYFLKKRNEKSKLKNVIVKFENKKSKEKFMTVKAELKKDDENRVFVNDLLSKETMSLLSYAKTLKSVGYATVYPNHGRIFARKSAISRPRLIRNEDDVDNILLEASTNKPMMRKSLNNGALPQLVCSDDEGQADFMSPLHK